MGTNPDSLVVSVFESYPKRARGTLLDLRRLVLETAAQTEAVGPVTETLKWGEPAYLTEVSKSGSTIRLGWSAKSPDHVALLFNCNSTLVDTFRTVFPDLEYQGNRAIVLNVKDELPVESLRECIAAALTYHKSKVRRGFNK